MSVGNSYIDRYMQDNLTINSNQANTAGFPTTTNPTNVHNSMSCGTSNSTQNPPNQRLVDPKFENTAHNKKETSAPRKKGSSSFINGGR
jgi:hypothetical protein